MFRIMWITGVLAVLGLIAVFATEDRDKVPNFSWRTYTSNKDPAYSVTYPQGWRVAEIDRHGTELEVRFLSSQDTYLSVITSLTGTVVMDILKGRPATQHPLRDFHEMLIDGMKGRFRRFEAMGTTEMKVAGAEAYGATFKYHTWNPLMGRVMEGMLVTTWAGDDYVGLAYACPERDRHKMFAAFGTFMASFKPRGVEVMN